MSNQSNALKKSLNPTDSQNIIDKASAVSPKTDSSHNESSSKILQNMANFGSTPSYSLRAMKRAEDQGTSSSKKNFATLPYDEYESTNLILGGKIGAKT